MHGLNEVDVIHGRGYDVSAGVAIGGNGSCKIDEVHEPAAKQVAERVGIVGQDDLSHFGLGAGHGPYRRVGFSRAH